MKINQGSNFSISSVSAQERLMNTNKQS